MQIKEIFKAFRKTLFGIAVSNRWYNLTVIVYFFAIKELTVNGKVKRLSLRNSNNRLTILVFYPRAFRKDLDCIVATDEFRVLIIQDHWLSVITGQFYPAEFLRYHFHLSPKYRTYLNPNSIDFKLKIQQEELRKYLYNFLSKLYRFVGIDCVISPHPRYVAAMEWGAVSTKLGVPHILVSRDSQFASSPYLLNKMKLLFREALPKYEGKHIIIQTELDKDVYIDTGYVNSERISSLGCPRMDDFVKARNEKKRSSSNRRKKVVFLPLFWFSDFEKKDLSSYFTKLHLCFVEFAIHHPEIDVVMKTKPKDYPSWRKNIFDETMASNNIDLSKIPNLILGGDLDLHSLFTESDVVCGLNTSAVLEAAVIGLPVIIPYFKDLQNRKYEERIFYRDAYDLFDIAESAEDLESLISKRLQNPVIDRGIMERRKAYFEKHISSLKGDATKKYVALIKRVVLDQQSNRVSYN